MPTDSRRPQVGDEIRVLDDREIFGGEVGTILRDDRSELPFLVHLCENTSRSTTHWFYEHQIELTSPSIPSDTKENTKTNDSIINPEHLARLNAFVATHPVPDYGKPVLHISAAWVRSKRPCGEGDTLIRKILREMGTTDETAQFPLADLVDKIGNRIDWVLANIPTPDAKPYRLAMLATLVATSRQYRNEISDRIDRLFNGLVAGNNSIGGILQGLCGVTPPPLDGNFSHFTTLSLERVWNAASGGADGRKSFIELFKVALRIYVGGEMPKRIIAVQDGDTLQIGKLEYTLSVSEDGAPTLTFIPYRKPAGGEAWKIAGVEATFLITADASTAVNTKTGELIPLVDGTHSGLVRGIGWTFSRASL
jgi:hypothetical protein